MAKKIIVKKVLNEFNAHKPDKTADQMKFEEWLKEILLTKEERKTVGYDWLIDYKEELDDFLLEQYRKTKSQTAKRIKAEIEKHSETHTRLSRQSAKSPEHESEEIRCVRESWWQQFWKEEIGE